MKSFLSGSFQPFKRLKHVLIDASSFRRFSFKHAPILFGMTNKEYKITGNEECWFLKSYFLCVRR